MTLTPRTRIRMALMMICMTMTCTYAQHLGSGRATAIGSHASLRGEATSFDVNPALLSGVKDWEVSLNSYSSLVSSSGKFSFHSGIIARQFGDAHAAALRVSPGLAIDFRNPSTIVIRDSNASLVTSFDKEISYAERFAVGYAFRPSPQLALGVSARFLQEHVTDTKYSVDTNYVIHSGIVGYDGAIWTADLGLLWNADQQFTLALAMENAVRIVGQKLPDDAGIQSLQTPRIVKAGVTYAGVPRTALALEGDTERRLRCGMEWTPLSFVAIRGGVHLSADGGLTAEAVSAGIGFAQGVVRLDAGYLRFVRGSDRTGSGSYTDFIASGIQNLEFNDFSGNRLTLTASLRLGRTTPQTARVEYAHMLTEVYPSARTAYAFQPIVSARVRNISDRPEDVRVSFYVPGVMDAPTESAPRHVPPGEVAEVSLPAIFNNAAGLIGDLTIREGEVIVASGSPEVEQDRFQTRVVFRGRNDWNGDVALLRYFATADDPEVLQFSRRALNGARAMLDTVPEALQTFARARVVFDDFARRLLYVNDPKKSRDHVQYPSETLSLNGGDCDDMSVCYAALMASMGVGIAFVDVVPPDRPDDTHVYLMFDSGIPSSSSALVAENAKRFVVRKNTRGVETVWIPIETTDIKNGFDAAWSSGAAQYYRMAEIELGLIRGWMRIVDLEPSY